MPLTRPLAIAVTTKFQVQAFAINEISSHSQSFPTLPVATFQEGDTSILEAGEILAFVIVNLLLLTGTPEPKSISASMREKLPHPPGGTAKTPSPRKKVVEFRVPLAINFTIAIVSSSICLP